MKYSVIKGYDIANGPGVRVSIFVSGCRNHCPGCFQPETWDFGYGQDFDINTYRKIYRLLRDDSIQGLTILGGDPMEPENQMDVSCLITCVLADFKDKDIWLYTGYVYGKNIRHTPYTKWILAGVDVLVDGPFIEEEKDITLRFRGSRNQRVIDMKKTTRNGGGVVLWEGI